MSSRKNKRGGGTGRRPTASERARTRPCPCGSGLAYKNCCARKERDEGEEPAGGRTGWKAYLAAALAVCALAGAILVAVWRPWSGPEETPEPWEYDEAGNRHWHPAHGHWHDGPPPARFRDAPASPGSPEAWEYDAANDRHWHPGHEHWHEGSPPPPAER